MKVSDSVQPPSLADQLRGNPQKALKEKVEETAEKVKTSANDEVANLVKANDDAQHLIDEAKSKANQIFLDATDEAKPVALGAEDLKLQNMSSTNVLLLVSKVNLV
jgi:cell division septum initiation protein DivIVA